MFSKLIKRTTVAIAFAAASLGGMSAAQAGGYASVVVPAYSSHFLTYQAYSNELFRVTIDGDGDTDVDLIVRGPTGNVLCVADGPVDFESCLVRARSGGGQYSVELRNLGRVWNRVEVAVG